MSELEQLLYETTFRTRDTYNRVIRNFSKEELDYMEERQKIELQNLKNKYSNNNLSDEQLMKQELTEFMSIIIDCINKEYGELIPNDRLSKLNNMINNDGVIVIYDENDKHDFSADSEKGHVIVNLARIGVEKEKPMPSIYEQIIRAKGTLPHELFHIIIKMLKPKDVADERMIINLIDAESITSRGMVGFILNEGYVEKYSNLLCEKYGLYHQIAPQYLPYIDVCDYIMSKYLSVNSNTIFSLDESDILSKLSDDERMLYHKYECISYAVRHRNIPREKVISSHIEHVDIDLSSLSSGEIGDLQNYYLNKNNKLAQTSSIEISDKHL